MPLYQALVLAVVQGITEFLPISSTAHLILFPWFFHWKDPGLTFDVALHLGTLVAVLIYFWRLWLDMVLVAFRISQPHDRIVQQNKGLFWLLCLGTIPAGIAGWELEHVIETQLRQPMIIGAALVVVGILMWMGDRVDINSRKLGQVNLKDAVTIGIAQASALVPGVSRSGATMTAGLFAGLDREASAQFSFLLSTPVIAGAVLKKGTELHAGGIAPGMEFPFAVGILVAAIVGYIVIDFLIRFLQHRTFKVFVIYRISLGVIVLVAGEVLRYHVG